MSWESVSCWIEHHPGLASWVQALGAIAALGIAIWIPNRQRGADRKEAHKKEKVLLLVFLVDCEFVITITQRDSATLDVRKRLISELIARIRLAIETDTNPDRAADCLRLRYEFEGILWELEQNEAKTEAYVELTDDVLEKIFKIKQTHCADVQS
jgi:hypothetical protein